MVDAQFITYETVDDGRIARIMLNRPEARNAQNRGLLVELNDAFLRAEADDAVRVVILGGVGTMFSSGHDMGSDVQRREFLPGPEQHPTRQINGGTREAAEALMLQEWHYYFESTRRWRNLRKITIAEVHGPVFAAGLMLAWACDLIVAAEGTEFADVVGTRLGMCGVEYFGHPWEFGPRRAKELLLTGDSMSVDEAHAIGMVSKVFPADELAERTLRVRASHRRPADDDCVAHQGRRQSVGRQHGLLQRAQRLLHAARAEPFALGMDHQGRVRDGDARPGRSELARCAADTAAGQSRRRGAGVTSRRRSAKSSWPP